jgi:hypothetical protein
MNVSHFERIVFVAAMLWLPGALSAQNAGTSLPVNPETKRITYQEVVKVEGLQNELFTRAIDWINVFYKNPADATKVRNLQSGIIEISHNFDLHRIDEQGNKIAAGIVIYALRLELKDGRYRYTLTDMSLKQSSRFPVERWLDKTDKAYNPNYEAFLSQLDTQVKALTGSLKQAMLPGIPQKKDVW